MWLLQLIVTSFLLSKVYLKVVNKKYDLIFPQDSRSFYDHSSNYVSSRKKQYMPLIDGQPIIIPEEFAEEFKKDHSSALKEDEVFLVNSKNDLTQKPMKNKDNKYQIKKATKIENSSTTKPKKSTKVCKNSQKNRKKTTTENKKEHFNVKTESAGASVVDANHEGKIEVPQTMPDIFEADNHLSLQNEVRNMFGSNFQSFVFNPLASSKSKFQECQTSKNETGFCRYVQHCFLPSIVGSIQQFLNNVCIIENRYIGICCPDFPVQEVSVNWQNALQSSDRETNTPDDCGIGTNTRIVGGTDANVKAYPWMVALFNNKKTFFCGGALINDRYVLTAAHCTFGVNNNEIIARVGEIDLGSEQGEDYRVVNIKRHAQYNRLTLRNDIALLKLEKNVIFNEFVKTICLPDGTKNYTGHISTLAGWGRLQGGSSKSDILQEVEFPIVTNEECSVTHGLPIPESLICTSAPQKDKSACNGDSGGPLMTLDSENRWKVVGIVSWGRRGCNTKFPSVFTRVTQYLDWIKQHAT